VQSRKSTANQKKSLGNENWGRENGTSKNAENTQKKKPRWSTDSCNCKDDEEKGGRKFSKKGQRLREELLKRGSLMKFEGTLKKGGTFNRGRWKHSKKQNVDAREP